MVGPWQLEKSQQEFYPNKGFGVAKIKNGKGKISGESVQRKVGGGIGEECNGWKTKCRCCSRLKTTAKHDAPRTKARLGDDEIYHLIELKEETDFIHNDILISPFPIMSLASVRVRIVIILFLIQYIRYIISELH